MNFGHIIIQKDGKKCTCGNRGCFETYCSMSALKSMIASRMNLETITGNMLYELIKTNTEEFDDIIDEYIQNLNIGFSNYINIFEPEAICIGGSFVYYEDIFLKRLVKNMQENNLTFNKYIPEFKIAKMR